MGDVRDGFLGVSQLNTKPIAKPFLLSCWHLLKLKESPFYLGLLEQTKPRSIILNRRQKGAGQGMILTLVSHWHRALDENGENIGFGDKPSHLNIFYFHDFLINIYCRKKNVVHYFLGSPHTS
jgi:hypothetical protein